MDTIKNEITIVNHFAFAVVFGFGLLMAFLASTLLVSVGVEMLNVELFSGYAVVCLGVIALPAIVISSWKFAKLDAYS